MLEYGGPLYLIIGNGIAGITAAEVLHREDPTASIAILSEDIRPTYYRPALKDYLRGTLSEEKLFMHSDAFYQERQIELQQGCVVRIKPAQHRVVLDNGSEIGYQKLLLACGAHPTRLTCAGNELEGVATLYSIDDYQSILRRLEKVRHAVVYGSDPLAIDTVEALRKRKITVTHILPSSLLWPDMLDATASDLILQRERRDGVNVRLEEDIVEIKGRRGRVTGVELARSTPISCELVIVANGFEANCEWIRQSGIACGKGVRVNARMQTGAPDIYAAGDVVEIIDASTGRARILAQWYPALQQARVAALSMLGRSDVALSNTYYYASFLYGVEFAAIGVTRLARTQGVQEVLAEPKAGEYRKLLLQQGLPLGVLAIGNRKGIMDIKRAMDHRVDLSPVQDQIFSADFRLGDWLDQQGVPPLFAPARKREEKRKHGQTASLMPVPERDTRSASSPLTAWLVAQGEVADIVDTEKLYLSQKEAFVVGREPDVTLMIDRGTISRFHAEIRFANGVYLLKDLESTNGTFVNGQRLPVGAAYILKDRDVLSFGSNTRFVFRQSWKDQQAVEPVQQGKLTGGRGVRAAHFLTETSPTVQIKAVTGQLPVPELLICPHCGIANTRFARFCASCSKTLTV